MDEEIIYLQTERTQQSLSRIRAKIAIAGELLIEVRQDLEELYVLLDETEEERG